MISSVQGLNERRGKREGKTRCRLTHKHHERCLDTTVSLCGNKGLYGRENYTILSLFATRLVFIWFVRHGGSFCFLGLVLKRGEGWLYRILVVWI